MSQNGDIDKNAPPKITNIYSNKSEESNFKIVSFF